MNVYLGADHAGFKLKNDLKDRLEKAGHTVVDLGAKTLDSDDDYPKYAYLMATQILGEADEEAARGILICGSGQGMSMAANRVNGIRAALAWNEESAQAAREDDNANVLVLPARFVEPDQAWTMTEAWLKAEFKANPKYQRRLDELEELYG
jgi:ribose 5-phosphate isomerase B